jgi:DNA-binding CsgD family transcriptional regulator
MYCCFTYLSEIFCFLILPQGDISAKGVGAHMLAALGPIQSVTRGHISADPCEAEAPLRLSPRETETLDLIGKGCTSKEIAGLMGLRPTTVASYRRSLCRKLGLHSTASLAAYAARFSGPADGSPQS